MTHPTGKYMATVTEFGCIPVSEVFQTKQFGWTLIRLDLVMQFSELKTPGVTQEMMMM